MAGVSPSEPAVIGHPSFLSPHSRPMALNGEHVFVANTPADTVDVIDRRTGRVVRRIAVGVDPVRMSSRMAAITLFVGKTDIYRRVPKTFVEHSCFGRFWLPT